MRTFYFEDSEETKEEIAAIKTAVQNLTNRLIKHSVENMTINTVVQLNLSHEENGNSTIQITQYSL